MKTPTLEKVSQLDQLKRFSKVVADTGDEDAMATEKTAEGIRKFTAGIRKLERLIEAKQ